MIGNRGYHTCNSRSFHFRSHQQNTVPFREQIRPTRDQLDSSMHVPFHPPRATIISDIASLGIRALRDRLMKLTNRYSAALLLFLASASPTLFAQDKPTVPLFEATHCLATEKHGWLDLQSAKELSLGYLTDAKTVLGDKYLYVVVYTNPQRTQGKIFDIRIKKGDRQRVYSIENDATFVSTPKEVTFPQPPLGGTWAQTQFSTAIQHIEHHHKWYVAPVKSLLKPTNHIRCESSTDQS